ncbi:MAG TPA: hypothetical protein VMV93_11855 [Chloroflexota bacterium]|nr:hypothetical protein [Chloroflexota bacterium]
MILDPTGHRATEQAQLAPRGHELKGATIGLLNSTKRNSDILLQALGEELVQHYGVKEVMEVTKPTFSLPVPPDQVDQMVQRCHFIIAGVGD